MTGNNGAVAFMTTAMLFYLFQLKVNLFSFR